MIPFAFAKLLDGSGLEVKQRERDGIVILDLEGRLVLGEEELALRQRIESLVEGGARKLILNLKGISEIDSTGLGTLEFCALGSDGADNNAALHFQAMSNELSTPIILVCPADSSKRPAFSFQNLQSVNVSYRLYSGTNLDNAHPQATLALCPMLLAPCPSLTSFARVREDCPLFSLPSDF